MRALITTASIVGLLLVAAGAVGAHLIPVEDSGLWDGALLFGFVHTLAALASALAPLRGWLSLASGWMFLAGVVLFSGIQIVRLLAPGLLSGLADAVGPLVPAGGFAFMVGWALLAASALLSRRTG